MDHRSVAASPTVRVALSLLALLLGGFGRRAAASLPTKSDY